MKLTVLGSCSGTEPVAGRGHTSLAIEHDGLLYIFDAGEGCSRTAHLMGMDLMAVRAIFISHPHMDHVGGLPNLLWTIRKLDGVSGQSPGPMAGRAIDVFLPNMGTWQGVMQILDNTEGGFSRQFDLRAHQYGDGEVFDGGGLSVRALHNMHLGEPGPGQSWQSYSFRIEAGGRSIVFSGDVKALDDLAALIADGCDMLLMETGHHKVADVCGQIRDQRLAVGRLLFVHHGRAVLDDPAGQLAIARGILGRRVDIADDGQQFEIQ
jgi:ribonuclease BN (tRNA processing enzyme)